MSTQPYEDARRAAIGECSPADLVILLYETARSEIQTAHRAMTRREIAERARAVQKATDCVVLLAQAVDPQPDPALAARLHALYAYVLDRLREANFQQRREPLEEADRILVTLLEGWRGCRAESAGGVYGTGPLPAADPAAAFTWGGSRLGLSA